MGVAKKDPPNFNLLNPPIGGPQIKKKSGVKPNQKSRENFFFVVFNFFNKKNLQKS